MDKVKLIITYHSPHTFLCGSTYLIPMQTGKAITSISLPTAIGDDTGENISDRNDAYNELTAQYWVWKNFEKIDNPDYVGFMHYRRHFLFDKKLKHSRYTLFPNHHLFLFPYINNSYSTYFSDEAIRSTIYGSDCLTLPLLDVRNIHKSKTIKKHYLSLAEQEERFFDIFIDSAQKLAPDYSKEIERIENGTQMYICNMFIMRKEIFFKYNEFMFPILMDIEKKIDTTGFSPVKKRFLGYFGEYLLTIFMFKLKQQGILKLKEIEGIFILSDRNISYPYIKFWWHKIFSKVTFGQVARNFRKRKVFYRMYCQSLK